MSWLISAGVFHIEETVLWSAFLWPLGVYDLFRHFFPLPYVPKATMRPQRCGIWRMRLSQEIERLNLANWNFQIRAHPGSP